MKLIQKIKQVFTTKNTNIMKKGTVKFFNNSKGFGFIQEDESNEDIFVHMSGLIDDIRENDEVQFETAQGKSREMVLAIRPMRSLSFWMGFFCFGMVALHYSIGILEAF